MAPKGKFQLPSILNEQIALPMEFVPFLPEDNAINNPLIIPSQETMTAFTEWNEKLSLLLKSNVLTFLSTIAFRDTLPVFFDSFFRYTQRPSQNVELHPLHKFVILLFICIKSRFI